MRSNQAQQFTSNITYLDGTEQAIYDYIASLVEVNPPS